MSDPTLLLVADVVSAALMLVVAVSFLRIWRLGRDPLHLLVAAGFALLALGMSVVSASEYDISRAPDRWDALRLVGHTSAALVLFLSYATASRPDGARPGFVVGGAVVGLALLAVALVAIVPPAFELPSLATTFLVAHAVQLVLYLGCAAISAGAFARRPSATRALVPAAFLCYAASKYTWLLIDISGATQLVPFIYFWRAITIALLLSALWWRLPSAGGEPAPA